MHHSSTVDPPVVKADIHTTDLEHVRARHTHSHSSPLRVLLIGFAAAALLVLILIFGYSAAHNDRVYRGVSVLGSNLGGMSRAEAQAVLAQAAAGYPSDSLTLSGAGRTWTFSPADLGL